MSYRKMIITLLCSSLIFQLIMITRFVIVNQKHYEKFVPISENLSPTESEKGKQFHVSKLIVLRGDYFDITIKDGSSTRILGKLTVMSTENAKGKVLDLLNHSTNPKVVLLEKQTDGLWAIDFFFTSTSTGKELSLSEWLISNNLVYK